MRIGIITISDRASRGERPDLSGPALEESIKSQGWKVVRMVIIPDDLKEIKEKLISWPDSGEFDIIRQQVVLDSVQEISHLKQLQKSSSGKPQD